MFDGGIVWSLQLQHRLLPWPTYADMKAMVILCQRAIHSNTCLDSEVKFSPTFAHLHMTSTALSPTKMVSYEILLMSLHTCPRVVC